MPTLLPRLNVTVTREQHALLLELASLDPDTPSAAAFIRQLIDQVTPLLRTTVPMMREAQKAHGGAREQLREPLRDFMAVMAQMDLLDAPAGAGAPEPQRRRSEDGRTKPAGRRKP
jgi:hypothetical protein